MIRIIFLSCSIFLFYKVVFPVDPFSRIKITSNKATCQKCKDSPHTFVFNYLEKVSVTLADDSKITADKLEIILDSKDKKIFTSPSKKRRSRKTCVKSGTQNELSHVKRIVFKSNIFITNQNREVRADLAEIDLLENTCKLDGRVKIKQTKVTQNDIPLEVESTRALINLKTSEIVLLGSSRKPVSTVIELSKNLLYSSNVSCSSDALRSSNVANSSGVSQPSSNKRKK